jgi:putative membrane protein
VNVVTQVFVPLAALVHIGVGTPELLFYDRPAARLFLTTSTADAPEVTL